MSPAVAYVTNVSPDVADVSPTCRQMSPMCHAYVAACHACVTACHRVSNVSQHVDNVDLDWPRWGVAPVRGWSGPLSNTVKFEPSNGHPRGPSNNDAPPGPYYPPQSRSPHRATLLACKRPRPKQQASARVSLKPETSRVGRR